VRCNDIDEGSSPCFGESKPKQDPQVLSGAGEEKARSLRSGIATGSMYCFSLDKRQLIKL